MREVYQVFGHTMVLHSHHHCVRKNEEGYGKLEILVVDHVKEDLLAALGLIDLNFELLALAYFLDLDPGLLVVGDEHASEFLLLFDLVKVVYDDSNEQVDDELAADDHKGANVEDGPDPSIFLWLHLWTYAVDAVPHHIGPSFCSHHLEEGQESHDDIVKVGIDVVPLTSCIQTILFGYDLVQIYRLGGQRRFLAPVKSTYMKK